MTNSINGIVSHTYVALKQNILNYKKLFFVFAVFINDFHIKNKLDVFCITKINKLKFIIEREYRNINDLSFFPSNKNDIYKSY
jgi:hypothetical protein